MVEKPAFLYFGAKWNIADKIIKYFPRHKHYIDGCGGSAAMLLKKTPSAMETYNDINGEVVNFFQVLRESPEQLIALLELTPYSRQEFENSTQPTNDRLEKARRFYVKINMSRGNYLKSNGFRINRKGVDMFNNLPSSFNYKIRNLRNVAKRFLDVQIESIDAIELASLTSHPEALFYYDPPYTPGSRVSKKVYKSEMSDTDHIAAAEALNDIESMVIVSGYQSELYQELYGHWERIDIETWSQKHSLRTESIWLNPATVAALNLHKQLRLV